MYLIDIIDTTGEPDIITQILDNTQKIKIMLYLRTPLHGNEFKVCDELTDEIIAIFYNQQDAIDYINFKTNKQTTF
jgi:hypothetical protein